MSHTLRFYKTLGFKINENGEKSSYIRVNFENISIAFYTMDSVNEFFSPQLKFSTGNQFNISIRIGSPEQLEDVNSKMTLNGYNPVKGPLDAEWGQKVVFYKDPDGNLIELCAYLNK